MDKNFRWMKRSKAMDWLAGNYSWLTAIGIILLTFGFAAIFYYCKRVHDGVVDVIQEPVTWQNENCGYNGYINQGYFGGGYSAGMQEIYLTPEQAAVMEKAQNTPSFISLEEPVNKLDRQQTNRDI